MGDDKVSSPDPTEPILDSLERNKPSPYARAIIFPLLRMCGIDCSLAEVANGTHLPLQQHLSGYIATKESIDTALNVALRSEVAEAARRQAIDDKAKWLFGLNSVLLTIVAGVLTRQSGTVVIVLGLAALAVLVLVALLLLWYFGLRTYSRCVVDNELLTSTDMLKVQQVVLDGLLNANEANGGRNAFLADVYRAALRLTLAALLIVVAIAPASLASPTTPAAEHRCDRQLVPIQRRSEEQRPHPSIALMIASSTTFSFDGAVSGSRRRTRSQNTRHAGTSSSCTCSEC